MAGWQIDPSMYVLNKLLIKNLKKCKKKKLKRYMTKLRNKNM